MEIQGRTYMTNGQSILLKEYGDVNKASQNLEFSMQNSLGSNAYQTSSKFQPYPENNNNNANNNYVNSGLNYPVQNFGNTTNPMLASNGFGQSISNNFPKTADLANQSINMNETQKTNKAQTFTPGQAVGPNNTQMYQLTEKSRQQLNKEVEQLYDYYYQTKGYFQNDQEELFRFYLEYKRRSNKGVRVPPKVQEIMKYREGDVYESIGIVLSKIKDRFKLSQNDNFSTYQNSKVIRSMSAKKGFDNTVKNTYKVKLTKETEERLYPRLKELKRKEQEKKNCDDFNSYFKKLLESYKKNKGEYTNDKDELINYYKNMKNREEKKMEWENGETDFIENMELFFNDDEMVTRMSDLFYRHTKFRTYHPTTLHNHWEHFMTKKERYLNGVNKYSKDDFYSLLEKCYTERESEKIKERDNQEDEEKAREEQYEREYRNRIRETREEREELINELAQPKDKYKTGRVMLELKEKFKYDNIIKKMIKNEFKDNKLFKFPEEYAVRDEEEEKDIFFKHDLNKEIKKKNNEEKIKKQIEDAYEDYNYEQNKRRPIKEKKFKEKKELFDFIKEKVKEYYKNMALRLTKGKNENESINLFLNNVYKEMSKKYRNATKIYFKRPRLEVLKKTYKYKKIQTFYPKKLKFYFFRLLRRIGTDEKGNLVFARNDNIPFWSPSLSNQCKIHGNNCPIYCCYNTHNNMIKESKEKNFNTNFNIKKNKKKLEEKETLNLWKRPDLIKKKEQIFMCFDDAEHCTFEPKLSKPTNNLEKDDIINSRLNNDKWVKEMGNNFTMVRGTIYKEGILKKAKILFAEGKYKDTIKELKKAFDLSVFETYKPRFLLKEGETNKFIRAPPKPEEEKKEEEKKEEKKEEEKKEEKKDEEKKEEEKKEEKKEEEKSNIIKMPGFNRKIDLSKPMENFTNEKNIQLLDEVYFMLETIKEYEKRQIIQSKNLKKEMKLIEHERGLSGNKLVLTKNIDSKDLYDPNKNIQYGLMKQKYFNPKSTMCKRGDSCPYYLKGEECPDGAHLISELKFKNQIKENIKLRKNLISKLDKAPEPIIEKEWIPSGKLVNCGLADGSAGGKCICGFCKYRNRNYNETKERALRKMAMEKNEKLLKKREERIKKEKQKNKK